MATVPRTLKPLHPIAKRDATARFQQAMEQIESLRNELINKAIDEKLSSKLCPPESFDASQEADALSFALLAGQIGFWPTSLMGAAVPQFVMRHPKYAHIPDLFQFLMQGEVHGASLLLGRDNDSHPIGSNLGDSVHQFPHKASPLAEAFPLYMSRLAVGQKRAACAAACAVVFPRWARICQRLLKTTLNEHEATTGGSQEMDGSSRKSQEYRTSALLDFFSTSLKEVDEMAAAIMMQEDLKSCTFHDMSNHVRMLQEYELLFWDACDIVIGAAPKNETIRVSAGAATA